MPKLDPFSAQIVQLVRTMPDDAILELVRNQLGLVAPPPIVSTGAAASGSTKRAATRRKAATPSTAKKKKATKSKAAKKKASRAKAPSAERSKTLDQVERVIKSAKGLSASEIVKRTKLPKSRVSSAVRELKGAGRIHQGGDRRFARYAADARTAQQASEQARKTAPGPIRKSAPKKAKKAKTKRKTRAKAKRRK